MNYLQNFNGFSQALTFKLRDKGKISLKKGLKRGRVLLFVLTRRHLEKLLFHQALFQVVV